ncbi:hypothetical protein [Clavibacter michiganensis]|uniref:hypothetical protein n=1 Tax=Clavibacter michiganensis TaxID=28447 RepID=UPI00292E40A2|nr:hypothetical protein [Clavibacter michiganensis]
MTNAEIVAAVIDFFVKALPALLLTVIVTETYKRVLDGITPWRIEYMAIGDRLKALDGNGFNDEAKSEKTLLEERRLVLHKRLAAANNITWSNIPPLILMLVGAASIALVAYVDLGGFHPLWVVVAVVGSVAGTIWGFFTARS